MQALLLMVEPPDAVTVEAFEGHAGAVRLAVKTAVALCNRCSLHMCWWSV
jgi:hypothetical protein